MLPSLSFVTRMLSDEGGGIDHLGYFRIAFKRERLVSRFFHFKLSSTSTDLTSYDEPGMTLPCWLGPVVLQFFLSNPSSPFDPVHSCTAGHLSNYYYSPNVRDCVESKIVLDSGLHAVDSGFQVLNFSLCQWNLDCGFHRLYIVRFQVP